MKSERINSLSAMREALSKAPSQHTPLFLSLMSNGKNHPHACKLAQRLVFGQEEFDFPGLGKRISPFDATKLLSLKELQMLLLNDYRTVREQYGEHIPRTRHDEDAMINLQTDDENEDLSLLMSLLDADNVGIGGSMDFPSPSLEDICGDTKVEYDNTLRESMTHATVLQRITLLPLQHSNEGTTFTTLLSGAVAWFIWPPTEHNLDVLRSYYDAYANRTEGAVLNVTDGLQGGVSFVQCVGEAVRIPPFCPMLCLSMEGSILATYSVVTIEQCICMLNKLPLLQAFFKTEIGGERVNNEVTTALLDHLCSVLQGSFETVDLKKHKYPYRHEGPLQSLLEIWDDVNVNLVGMLSPKDAERVKVMWENFLRDSRGRECWICGRYLRNKLNDTRKHFEANHWPAGSAAEPLQHQEGIVAGSFLREDTEETSSHDAMEIITAGQGVLEGRLEEDATFPAWAIVPEGIKDGYIDVTMELEDDFMEYEELTEAPV